MENQLNEKNAAFVKTQDDLRHLEGLLTDMKQELLRLKGHSQNDISLNNTIDRQARERQVKFEDINEFLLENPHDSDKIKSHLVIR